MRAVGITAPGGYEVLSVIDRPVREPGPGEVRIAVRAAAVNPTDSGLRARGGGELPAPWTPGMDAAGTIESLGAGVERLQVGEQVMAAVTPRRPEGGAQAELLLAQLPTIVAQDFRRRRGLDRIAPDPSLGYCANFFHMCFGEVPEAEVVSAFETSMILYAEHSFNASTFTARVVVSTLSDIYSGVTAAIGALKGPLHGGANEAVMKMMLEIDDPALAADWLRGALARKEKIMGFGHRVYKDDDSRVPTMKAALLKMAELRDGQKWVDMYVALDDTMMAEKRIHPNLDFPSGPAYYLMGFDVPMFTPLFVMARITGWTAHVIEQLGSNSLIRPLSYYAGPAQRSVPDHR